MFEKRKGIGRYGKEVEYTTLTKKGWRIVLAVIFLFVLYCKVRCWNGCEDYGETWDAHPERTRSNIEYDRALRNFGK
jgi:hypothetical protein